MKIKNFFTILLVITFSFFYFAKPILAITADQKEEILSDIVDYLNSETDLITEHYSVLEEIESSDDDPEYLAKIFFNSLSNLEKGLKLHKSFFASFKKIDDFEISNISEYAYLGEENGLDAIEYYRLYFESESEEDSDEYYSLGDSSFDLFIENHDLAVDLYNDAAGLSDEIELMSWSLWGSWVSAAIAIFLFIKSRKRNHLQAEIVRSTIYYNLFSGSFWMFLGFIITYVSLSSAFNGGGTYYIAYGPVIFGGWAFIKQLWVYLTQGRKVLNKLAREERRSVLRKNIYEEKEDGAKKPKSKNNNSVICDSCGKKQSKNGTKCEYCEKRLVKK